MLIGLNISNIVLIEKLNLEFGTGLNILTGETGAGKSILLDALSLALGARSDVGLVRHGCDCASVTAEFDCVPHAVAAILEYHGIEFPDGIILRRTLSVDGKSRAWINDTPVSIKVLKEVGDILVEVHGQFANHALLNQTTHGSTLDVFAAKHIPNYSQLLSDTRRCYQKYHDAQKRLEQLQDILSKSATEREFLEHNVSELRSLNPLPGEEEELSSRRAQIINTQKNAEILSEALQALSPRGVSLESQLFTVSHILQRIKGEENPYSEQIDKLYAAAEMVAQVAQALEMDDTDTENVDSIEERLFAIRAIARKHRVSADELPAVLERMTAQLSAIDNSDAQMQELQNLVTTSKTEFDNVSAALSDARRIAADKLRQQILGELPELKLGSCDFLTEITPALPTASGVDNVTFMIKTNPGSPFAPLHRAASGGELARLMLALRVVLAGTGDLPTFIFDEIDTGISGATATAVGQRLNRLAASGQALVITHSAQVAGFADRHFKISKTVTDDKTTTNVHEITQNDRINEIARIISGAKITDESIIMAKTLLKV